MLRSLLSKIPCFIVAIIMVFVGLGRSAVAEPSETALYLMTERLSLLDWGIYQLNASIRNNMKNEELFALPKFLHVYYMNVSYDWDTDDIVIYGNFEGNIKPTQELCKSSIYAFLTWQGLDPETRQPYTGVPFSVLAGHFGHLHFRDPNAPKNLRTIVDDMFRLEFKVRHKKSLKSISCQSRLTDPRVFDSEPK
jgi:hypothetical protein